MTLFGSLKLRISPSKSVSWLLRSRRLQVRVLSGAPRHSLSLVLQEGGPCPPLRASLPPVASLNSPRWCSRSGRNEFGFSPFRELEIRRDEMRARRRGRPKKRAPRGRRRYIPPASANGHDSSGDPSRPIAFCALRPLTLRELSGMVRERALAVRPGTGVRVREPQFVLGAWQGPRAHAFGVRPRAWNGPAGGEAVIECRPRGGMESRETAR